VAIDLDSGTASYRVSNLFEHDFGSIPNAITNGAVSGPPVDATVSFDLEWSGVTAQAVIANAKQGFAGDFFLTGATLSWSASNANGFSFASDPASTSNSVFAMLGHERNGRFFPAGGKRSEGACRRPLALRPGSELGGNRSGEGIANPGRASSEGAPAKHGSRAAAAP
jgi:hypothetical protein